MSLWISDGPLVARTLMVTMLYVSHITIWFLHTETEQQAPLTWYRQPTHVMMPMLFFKSCSFKKTQIDSDWDIIPTLEFWPRHFLLILLDRYLCDFSKKGVLCLILSQKVTLSQWKFLPYMKVWSLLCKRFFFRDCSSIIDHSSLWLKVQFGKFLSFFLI